MGDWKNAKKAGSLRPFKGQEMRKWAPRPETDRYRVMPIAPENLTGPKVWHGVMGNRTAAPLPRTSKGPIRARAEQRRKGIPGA